MRSAKTEAILKRIKAMFPQPVQLIRQQEPREVGNLQDDLRQTLDEVGQQNYALATARLFAAGGKYNAKRSKQRYALD